MRLPRSHCHYSPIEISWSQVKRKAAKLSKTFTKAEVEILMKEDLDMLMQEDWALCVRDTEILQEEDLANEIGRD